MPHESSSPLTPHVEPGYCHCGCGTKTELWAKTHTKRGRIKGQPKRYVHGHNAYSTVSVAERFWEKVDKRGPDDCWEWRNPSHTGYATFCTDATTTVAVHRFSWELENGPIPEGDGYHGTCVCHRCDNPSCVNPAHLFLGSHQDNMRDMNEKGRGRWRHLMEEAW